MIGEGKEQDMCYYKSVPRRGVGDLQADAVEGDNGPDG